MILLSELRQRLSVSGVLNRFVAHTGNREGIKEWTAMHQSQSLVFELFGYRAQHVLSTFANACNRKHAQIFSAKALWDTMSKPDNIGGW